jgi:hypothetical protein
MIPVNYSLCAQLDAGCRSDSRRDSTTCVSQSDNRHDLLFADDVPSTKSEGYYESSKRIGGFYFHGAEI